MHTYVVTLVAVLGLLLPHLVAAEHFMAADPFNPDLDDMPTPLLGTGLTPVKNNGICETTDGFPTEEQYDIGTFKFCDEHVDTKSDFKGGLRRIDAPITATYDLLTYDKKVVKWSYKLSWVGPKEAGYISVQECKVRLRSLYTSNRAGGFGKAYCIVKGTVADDVLNGKAGKAGMSGEGAVVILGGELDGHTLNDHPKSKGWVFYEAREKPFNK